MENAIQNQTSAVSSATESNQPAARPAKKLSPKEALDDMRQAANEARNIAIRAESLAAGMSKRLRPFEQLAARAHALLAAHPELANTEAGKEVLVALAACSETNTTNVVIPSALAH